MERTEEINLIFLLLLGSGGMLLLVLAIVLFVFIYQRKLLAQKINLQAMEKNYQQALLQSSIDIMETERRRIAQDLHDEIGASLTALKIYSGQIAQTADNQTDIIKINQQSRTLIEKTIQNVRSITRDLLPATLEHFGLEIAIQETIEQLNHQATTQVIFSNQIPKEQRLAATIELAIYRIARELLNNTYRYAQANRITLEINHLAESQEIRVFYQDNGKGFDFQGFGNPKTKTGIGLRSIEARVNALNGKIDLQSQIDKGITVEIFVPAIFLNSSFTTLNA
ncbi:MAG: histidine kinase [Microscillaceae bacterium]|jgi:signal transduction histidine kinase|nr:histidine kinase [Microscillaceae bacterium]